MNPSTQNDPSTNEREGKSFRKNASENNTKQETKSAKNTGKDLSPDQSADQSEEQGDSQGSTLRHRLAEGLESAAKRINLPTAEGESEGEGDQTQKMIIRARRSAASALENAALRVELTTMADVRDATSAAIRRYPLATAAVVFGAGILAGRGLARSAASIMQPKP